MIKRKLIVAIPLLLLAVATISIGIGTNQVRAWGGDFCGWHCGSGSGSGYQQGCGFNCGGFLGSEDCEFSCHHGLSDEQAVYQASEQCGAYCAGEQDAIFDYNHNMQYQPEGNCIPCQSEAYWADFHNGYTHEWDSFQRQQSNQGSSINIYGNNNYVSTTQGSSQQQTPLQQLSHVLCGFVNCASGLEAGYEAQGIGYGYGYGGPGQ